MSRRPENEKAKFSHINYAHRGLHREDKSIPENSLPAFRLAREKGYGAELDVQLSRDGRVVVFHDDTLNRVCGVDARVDARNYEELRELRLCGTSETIPLFSEVLEAFAGAGPLIVELKTGPRNRELCEKTRELLRTYRGTFCIESFDPRIVLWFKKNAPDIFRGQLACPKEDYGSMPGPLAYILSRCKMNILTRPDFIAYKAGDRPGPVLRARKRGTLLFAWTPHDASHEKDNDSVIFEFYEPEIKY